MKHYEELVNMSEEDLEKELDIECATIEEVTIFDNYILADYVAKDIELEVDSTEEDEDLVNEKLETELVEEYEEMVKSSIQELVSSEFEVEVSVKDWESAVMEDCGFDYDYGDVSSHEDGYCWSNAYATLDIKVRIYKEVKA